jgi:hypothetical protein
LTGFLADDDDAEDATIVRYEAILVDTNNRVVTQSSEKDDFFALIATS